MDLQKKILKQYLLLNDNPTLKEISMDTGIQFTRCFRLLNGSKMRVEELEIFKKIIFEKVGLKNSLEEMIFECSINLSESAIIEIEDLIRRKLKLSKIKTNKIKITEQSIA